MIEVNVGDVIREARKSAGMSQDALAHRVGVSEPTIRNAEANRRIPQRSTLAMIAAVLGIEPELLGLSWNDFGRSPDTERILSAIADLKATVLSVCCQKTGTDVRIREEEGEESKPPRHVVPSQAQRKTPVQ